MDRRTAWSAGWSTAWSAEISAAVEAVATSVAVLAAFPGTGADHYDLPGLGSVQETGSSQETGSFEESGSFQVSDPLRRLADDCLDGLAEVARLEARTAALKARLAAEYVQATRALAAPVASPQEGTARELALLAEVACVLTVSERTAGAFLSDARTLSTSLPLTLAALQSGRISWQHARIIVDETGSLDPAGAAALEAHFLDPGAPNPARGCHAGDLVPSRFRAKARTWRERHHRLSIEERHTKSAADRRVECVPDRDAMAWLSIYLPAATATGIWNRATTAARALQRPDEPRTLAQLRADITATWLLTNHVAGHTTGAMPDGDGDLPHGDGGTGELPDCTGAGVAGGVPSPRAQVLITVPVLALLGVTEEPAMLDGYGPIPPSAARALIADGADSFHRVLTDPRDGAPLEIGRTSYRVTKAMRQWLRLRDGRCSFPGCNNHSLDNEADHLLAWADRGTTGINNLGQLCPKHHRLKHRTGWTPTPAGKDNPPGWTSPAQRHYPGEHQDWEPPHWPPHWPDHPATTHTPGHQDQNLPPDKDLPPDPFPEWASFTAAHPWPAPDVDDPGWSASDADDHGPHPTPTILAGPRPMSTTVARIRP